MIWTGVSTTPRAPIKLSSDSRKKIDLVEPERKYKPKLKGFVSIDLALRIQISS